MHQDKKIMAVFPNCWRSPSLRLQVLPPALPRAGVPIQVAR